jgi:hypothetical protein
MKRNGSRGVSAISTIGNAISAGVKTMPTTEIAEVTAHAPRIQRVLTFQFRPLLKVLAGGREPSPHPAGGPGQLPGQCRRSGRDRDCEHVTIVHRSAFGDDQGARLIRRPRPASRVGKPTTSEVDATRLDLNRVGASLSWTPPITAGVCVRVLRRFGGQAASTGGRDAFRDGGGG